METPAPPVLGFDTGFFRRLYDGERRARAAWAEVRADRAVGVVSCVTLFELSRLGLRGAVPQAVAEAFVAAIPAACRVVWLDAPDWLRRAARLGHGVGLAMADTLILASLLDAEAATIFTTDADFERYDGPASVVVL